MKTKGLRSKVPSWCVVVMAVGASGCDRPSSERPGSLDHYDVELPVSEPEGPVFVDEDFELRADSPERCVPSGVLGPAEGLLRWAIPVTISARSQRAVPSGPMLFSAVMNGHVYRPTLASCKPPFPATTLASGQSAKAHVVFDLPSPEPPLKLVYEPFIIGRKAIRAQVLVPLTP